MQTTDSYSQSRQCKLGITYPGGREESRWAKLVAMLVRCLVSRKDSKRLARMNTIGLICGLDGCLTQSWSEGCDACDCDVVTVGSQDGQQSVVDPSHRFE
jgi:hypothetical protein